MPEAKGKKGAAGGGAAARKSAAGGADDTTEAGGTAGPRATTGADDTEGAPRPRRRQARGEARIAQLLQAAASVFGTSGYTASSTNAIAREAGVSPGTLYQFFPNKEAIAVELGDQLLHRWRDTYGAAFTPSHIELPLDRMLDAVLDPLIAFNCENPAFFVLMHGSEIPGRITEAHDTLHVTMLSRVEEILAGYLPDAPTVQLHRVAEMAFMVFKAGLDLVMAHEGEEREAYIRETKAAMYRYLDPLIGDDSHHLAPHARQDRTSADRTPGVSGGS